MAHEDEARLIEKTGLKAHVAVGVKSISFGIDGNKEQDVNHGPILDAKAEKVREETKMMKTTAGALVGGASGTGIGGGIGAGAGAVIGGIVGSIIPGPGTAIGILVGTAIGAGIGAGVGGGTGLATGYAVTKHRPIKKIMKKIRRQED